MIGFILIVTYFLNYPKEKIRIFIFITIYKFLLYLILRMWMISNLILLSRLGPVLCYFISYKFWNKRYCTGQVQGLWKVKNQGISRWFEEAKKLKDKFLSFEITHVLRVGSVVPLGGVYLCFSLYNSRNQSVAYYLCCTFNSAIRYPNAQFLEQQFMYLLRTWIPRQMLKPTWQFHLLVRLSCLVKLYLFCFWSYQPC